MCGICGKLTFCGTVGDEVLIQNMCNTIRHRGPDREGIYVAPYIGLGQARLAIVDLRDHAAPPLANEDQTVWIVFNGEIYNFQEIRLELEEKGHMFQTKTDTEVIVHLYEEYGVDCLQYLQGMFAFALWDSRKKRLFAARDRFGKKPFYYLCSERFFIFGSALRSITADPAVTIEPDFAALDSYLRFQYVPSPLTAFSGIAKLPPGHFLLCNSAGDVTIRSYWTPTVKEQTKASASAIQEELLERIQQAVRMRLIADVPLGALLSGGIDSATIVSLMAKESSKPVKTFSLGFEENDLNELPFARLIARRYGTDHHEVVLNSTSLDVLPELVRHYNEPFADPSALSTYHVAKLARQHVTVALTGDGADELFAGYANYAKAMRGVHADLMPLWLREKFARIAGRALHKLPYSRFADRLGSSVEWIGNQTPERFLAKMAIMNERERMACYQQKFHALIQSSKAKQPDLAMPWQSDMNGWDWMMRHDQRYYLPDCLMVKTDVASMAHGLELRSPMLDHTLVEFAATIPSNLKYDGKIGKKILRETVRHLLPAEILAKPKTGFGIPLTYWFQKRGAKLLKETLLSERSMRRGIFQHAFIARMVDEQINGRRNWGRKLWALLFLELWFQEFID